MHSELVVELCIVGVRLNAWLRFLRPKLQE
jgi:hypothetical protein